MPQPQYVFPEPTDPSFDKHGARGKVFPTTSPYVDHLILECKSAEGYTISLQEQTCEFTYYVIKGRGELVLDGAKHPCQQGDLMVIPPGHTFTFNGRLKLLLVNAPKWSESQELELPKSEALRIRNDL